MVEVWQEIALVEAGRTLFPLAAASPNSSTHQALGTTVYIATAFLWICFRNGTFSGVGMDFFGSPSILVFAALVGFVVVEVVLKFGA
jgi:hypothetical protein